jgi:hypothetical protein
LGLRRVRAGQLASATRPETDTPLRSAAASIWHDVGTLSEGRNSVPSGSYRDERTSSKPNRQFLSLGRSRDAYDRFSAAVELPLTVLALLWLPILVLPYIVHLAGIAAAD